MYVRLKETFERRITMNTIMIREHIDHYKQVLSALKRNQVDATLTIMVGRPVEVLGDESFSWKVLTDKLYQIEQLTRSTYVYQEGTQVSFISVLVDPNGEWAHGIMLTSTQPMSAKNYLKAVSDAECSVHDFRIPGSPIHRLMPGDDYGEI